MPLTNPDISQILELLNNSRFFNEMGLTQLKTIASNFEYLLLDKNEVLFKQGEKKYSGIFYLISGKINLTTIEDGNNLEIVNEIYENEVFNSLSIFYEETRSSTVTILEESKLLFIRKNLLVELCENNYTFNDNLRKKITIEFNREKLSRILLNIYSKEVDYSILRKIMDSGEWVYLKDNTELFSHGDPSDSMFFLVRGFLKAFIPIKNKLKEVGEIKGGEIIGEMGLLSDEPRSASIYSTRESVLFKITKENFDILMRSNPSVLFALSKQIILRFKKNQNVKTYNEDTLFLTLLYTSNNNKDPIVNCGFGESLEESLNSYEKSYFLSKVKVEEQLLVNDININLEAGGKYFPLDDYVTKISRHYKYIILETEIENTPWTNWCNNLSDKFLFLLNPTEGIQNNQIIDVMDQIQEETPEHLLVDRELIVCHENKDHFPIKTSEYMAALQPISNHYHINVNDKNDFSRLARIITNKSIGVAFGGGGARGLAHVGAYKALLDNGIPIDVVCGTSAGSMMAGIIASGFSIDKIKSIWENFGKDMGIQLFDYNLPYSSIFNGKKYHDALLKIFDDRKIEDLWLPMFCCAANITTAELKVFNRGEICKAVTASSSLPGLLTPVVEKDSLYVDGGLINNMPGDILKENFNSKLISINVSPEKELIPNFDSFPNQNSLMLKKIFAKRKFKKEYEELNIPTLGSIMVRSIMVGSAHKTKEVASLSDIYLNIPTNGFAMLNYDKINELFEIGYNYTNNQVKKYDLFSTLGIPRK
ncbi:MAG: cyclic nucleotide-binding domain-containing protein [Fidelibacterota bacterium]